MNDPSIAEKLVEALARPDGSPKLRPVHAIGIGATGHFVASDVARDYCIAEHFQGEKIDVTVRFSNGSGSATPHDGWSDVRGMATRFHLAEGDATDLIAMTLAEFFTPTPETFLDFAVTAKAGAVFARIPMAENPRYAEADATYAQSLSRRNDQPGRGRDTLRRSEQDTLSLPSSRLHR